MLAFLELFEFGLLLSWVKVLELHRLGCMLVHEDRARLREDAEVDMLIMQRWLLKPKLVPRLLRGALDHRCKQGERADVDDKPAQGKQSGGAGGPTHGW